MHTVLVVLILLVGNLLWLLLTGRELSAVIDEGGDIGVPVVMLALVSTQWPREVRHF